MFCVRNCVILQTCVESCLAPKRRGGVLLGILVGHVPLGSQNSSPISGQKMSFSTPDFNKMCVTSLQSCAVHGPICGRLMGCTDVIRLQYNPENGHKSAHGPHRSRT